MNRREFVNTRRSLPPRPAPDLRRHLRRGPGAAQLYDFKAFGNVHLLHFTDCHAQLMPVYFREPDVNLGIAEAVGRPHLVGRALLEHFRMQPAALPPGRERDLARTLSHAFTYLDFARAAKVWRQGGRFAHWPRW